MKKFIQRFAAMSVVFMMFCVTIAAQSVKSTENTRSGSPGVTVSPGYVLLAPGAYTTVTVTLEVGYVHPFLIYDGEEFQIGDEIFGDSFYAALLSDGSIYIQADNINEIDSDVIYVRALLLDDELSRNTRATVWGETIIINIRPDLYGKQQKRQDSSVKK